jgi:hypothetical protein
VTSERANLAHKVVEAFNNRDLDTGLGAVDEEIEWISLRSAIEGPYRGHEGMKKWWADTAANCEIFQIEMHEYRDVGENGFIARGLIHAQGRGGGVPPRYSNELVRGMGWPAGEQDDLLLRPSRCAPRSRIRRMVTTPRVRLYTKLTVRCIVSGNVEPGRKDESRRTVDGGTPRTPTSPAVSSCAGSACDEVRLVARGALVPHSRGQGDGLGRDSRPRARACGAHAARRPSGLLRQSPGVHERPPLR